MKNYWTILSLQIAAIFIVAMLASFIPDYLHSFFGDTYHVEVIEDYCRRNGFSNYIKNEPHYHWGYRHFLWCWMGFVIFVVQCIRVGCFVANNKPA